MASVPRAAKIAVVFACMLLAAAPALAQKAPAGDALDPARRAFEGARSDPAALNHQGEAEKRALSALKQHLVATATSVIRLEARLTELEETLPRLEGEERIAAAALAGRRDEVVRLLAALQRLARRPADGRILAMQDPLTMLRGRLLLGTAKPALARDARDLAAELGQLASLRDLIARQRRQQDDAVRRLAEERRVLAGLVEIRSGRSARPAEAGEATPSGTHELARQIQSIDELIDRLARARHATRLRPEDLVPAGPEAEPAPSDAHLLLKTARIPASRLPAAGPVIGRFGKPEDNGWTAQGITIATRSSAQVVAPRAGTAVFAEPFLGYGELLIIDHGEGYHVLLAGLERLDARVGDDLVSGEPIGVMGSDAGAADRLYIELRRGGRPIDPLPWLTENSDKVGG